MWPMLWRTDGNWQGASNIRLRRFAANSSWEIFGILRVETEVDHCSIYLPGRYNSGTEKCICADTQEHICNDWKLYWYSWYLSFLVRADNIWTLHLLHEDWLLHLRSRRLAILNNLHVFYTFCFSSKRSVTGTQRAVRLRSNNCIRRPRSRSAGNQTDGRFVRFQDLNSWTWCTFLTKQYFNTVSKNKSTLLVNQIRSLF